jgi:phosphoenolpyruvate-protein kinase (PTS system EI component)
MFRLTGIGVSPGVISGRAVILNQRTHALRYQIAAARIEREVARLADSRENSRQQLHDIRARVAGRRGPELASLFDAQLLMLDASTRSGRCNRSCTSSARCSTRWPTTTCANARGTWPISSAGSR